jgi:S1-C subfamily serine protease
VPTISAFDFTNGRDGVPAKLVGTDKLSDLALLKVAGFRLPGDRDGRLETR